MVSPKKSLSQNFLKDKNISDNSFLNCYKLIKKIYKNRKLNDQS